MTCISENTPAGKVLIELCDQFPSLASMALSKDLEHVVEDADLSAVATPELDQYLLKDLRPKFIAAIAAVAREVEGYEPPVTIAKDESVVSAGDDVLSLSNGFASSPKTDKPAPTQVKTTGFFDELCSAFSLATGVRVAA